VVHAAKTELVWCGQQIELPQEKTTDVGLEKHAHVVETSDTGIKVKLGDVTHRMDRDIH
jgi:superoxide reductase